MKLNLSSISSIKTDLYSDTHMTHLISSEKNSDEIKLEYSRKKHSFILAEISSDFKKSLLTMK